MNKALLNKNLRIHCEIRIKSTQRSLVFYDEKVRIKKENKTRVYVMQQCVIFMPSPTYIYNLLFFKKLTHILCLSIILTIIKCLLKCQRLIL